MVFRVPFCLFLGSQSSPSRRLLHQQRWVLETLRAWACQRTAFNCEGSFRLDRCRHGFEFHWRSSVDHSLHTATRTPDVCLRGKPHRDSDVMFDIIRELCLQ